MDCEPFHKQALVMMHPPEKRCPFCGKPIGKKEVPHGQN